VNWYALHVRSRFERKVRDALNSLHLEPFLPLYKERSRWSDRVELIERVLFPGYVFGHLEPDQIRKAVHVLGVVRILGTTGEAESIPDFEIDQVKRVLDSGVYAMPLPHLVSGQRVRIAAGSLTGIEGIVLRIKGELRVVVSINLLGRSVAAELDTDNVVPIQPLRAAA
jgi:transcription antitermination factor NusG